MKNVLINLSFAFCLLLAGIPVYAQDGDVSELKLTKKFEGESVESTKKFPVPANYSMLKLKLYGTAEKGKITITLIKPNGDKLKTVEIDATSDVSYEQTLDLKKNPAELTGDWQLKIQTDKAEGFYSLVIYTK
jgi:hypothetical protein